MWGAQAGWTASTTYVARSDPTTIPSQNLEQRCRISLTLPWAARPALASGVSLSYRWSAYRRLAGTWKHSRLELISEAWSPLPPLRAKMSKRARLLTQPRGMRVDFATSLSGCLSCPIIQTLNGSWRLGWRSSFHPSPRSWVWNRAFGGKLGEILGCCTGPTALYNVRVTVLVSVQPFQLLNFPDFIETPRIPSFTL